jgi:hypothetical protein
MSSTSSQTAQAIPAVPGRRRQRRIPIIIAVGVAVVLLLGFLMVARASSHVNKVALASLPVGVTAVEARATHYNSTRHYVGTLRPALSSVTCAHAPKPYTFAYEQPRNAVDVVVKTLAANGFKDVAVDPAKNTVMTRWFDTGYRFREVNEIDNGPYREYYTDVFLRYRISLMKKGG